jgi:hypothetical protein
MFACSAQLSKRPERFRTPTLAMKCPPPIPGLRAAGMAISRRNRQALIAVLGAGVSLCLAGNLFPAAAHFPSAADLRPSSAGLQTLIAAHAKQRKSIVSSSMELGPNEAEVFWPLYEQYEAKMDQIDDRYANEILGYAVNHNSFDNVQAAHRLDELVSTLQGRLDIQKWYIAKFRAALSAATVTRFFEIDDRLRTLLHCKVVRVEPSANSELPAGAGR